ncbi:MAG: helix-turn-helix transcriptional regulator [Cyanobacteria bacterium NC_groundwater_1444_Ag_S-0.65um_54_12]|nr:helix-turn-helix transcriptional regulator [Cyanobacteria bacterium NC_groundwater_1444_Ag_S-0.65um_54_12]
MPLSHDDFFKKSLEDPEVKAAYDALEQEFTLFEELLEARKRAGLTLEQVAEKMGTKPSVISRLSTSKHSPSVNTLKKYAKAVGHRLEIRMIPENPDNSAKQQNSKKRAI